jgi:hypothetical protein
MTPLRTPMRRTRVKATARDTYEQKHNSNTSIAGRLRPGKGEIVFAAGRSELCLSGRSRAAFGGPSRAARTTHGVMPLPLSMATAPAAIAATAAMRSILFKQGRREVCESGVENGAQNWAADARRFRPHFTRLTMAIHAWGILTSTMTISGVAAFALIGYVLRHIAAERPPLVPPAPWIPDAYTSMRVRCRHS